MSAAIFEAVGRPLTLVTVEDPRPAPDQVVIEVAHCGICGSDLHVTQHGLVPAGTILGHEFAGTIVETGRDVGGDWGVGDRVTALPIQACRACEPCAIGLPGLCSSILFTGTTLETPGAYAQYVRARGTMLQRLPAGVSFADGAMVEPLAVAHHAVGLAGELRAASVLVIGAGPIGVGVALFARLAGARHVVVSEPSPGRRQRALEMGATHAIDPVAGPVASAFATLAGCQPRVVFECVGNPGMLQQAIELVGVRGRVLVAGVCLEEDRIRPLAGLSKEVALQFSQCYTESDFSDVIDAIAHGRVDASPMLTEIIGFDELPSAFEALRQPADQCKLLIDPSRGPSPLRRQPHGS